MRVYHMRDVDGLEDAYLVAESVTEAHTLYIKKYGHDTEYVLRLDTGNSVVLIQEVKNEDATV